MRLYFDNLETKEYLFLLKQLKSNDSIYARRQTEESGYSQVLIGEKMTIYTGTVCKDRLLFRIMVKTKGINL
jgi:hypothetical protein